MSGDALVLNGGGDEVRVLGSGNVNREFDTEDFTISFYFKPSSSSGVQYLISKNGVSCSDTGVFFIRYVPATRTLNAFLGQDGAKRVNLITSITNTGCWQHVTLVRDDRRVRLYLNARFAAELGSASRVDISNNGSLIIGNSDCKSNNEVPFNGLIDDALVLAEIFKFQRHQKAFLAKAFDFGVHQQLFEEFGFLYHLLG